MRTAEEGILTKSECGKEKEGLPLLVMTVEVGQVEQKHYSDEKVEILNCPSPEKKSMKKLIEIILVTFLNNSHTKLANLISLYESGVIHPHVHVPFVSQLGFVMFFQKHCFKEAEL